MPAEIMHRTILKNFPHNKIVVFPQTVNYSSKKQQTLTSEAYNSHGNIIFLARDKVSLSKANKLFSNANIALYPDVVTSLIGKYSYNYKRDKVLFCMRNDGEQFYNRKEIVELINRISDTIKCDITDTTIKMKGSELAKNIEPILNDTFDSYARYRAIITDRYHGTIFSLIAGTPVIVLSSTDHKLSSGVDWFKNIYPNHIFFAQNLDEAYNYLTIVLKTQQTFDFALDEYFNREYYQQLHSLIHPLPN
jgi:exopolysaccharide biosynthesis predicted pyruvyltransferase EpsI